MINIVNFLLVIAYKIPKRKEMTRFMRSLALLMTLKKRKTVVMGYKYRILIIIQKHKKTYRNSNKAKIPQQIAKNQTIKLIDLIP